MEIKDIIDLKLIKDIKLFPNGNNVLISISESNPKLDKKITHLWKTDLNGSEPVRITNTEQGENYPQFMGKDKIAYLAINHGRQNIFVKNTVTGNEELLVAHNYNINSFSFSKDYTTVYFLAPGNNDKAIDDGLVTDFFKIDSTYLKSRLWKYDIKSGRKEIINSSDQHIRSINLSPDGKEMVVIVAPTALPNDEILSEIYILNLSDHKFRRITSNNVEEKCVSWSPDSKSLMFISDANREMEIYYQHNLFLLDLKKNKSQILLEDLKYEINSACFDRNGAGIYYLANMGVKLNLFYYNIKTAKNKQLTFENAAISNVYYDTRFDFMLCTISRPEKPDDIYELDLKGEIKRRLTLLNPWLNQIELAKTRVMEWKSSDGWTCEGVLYLPVNYDSTRNYPLIVQLHGGPAGCFNLSFPGDYISYAHVLAGKGYMVFQPNYRGSTGYGDNCMRAIIGHYFEKDVDDVIYGIKHLVKIGLADSNRIGVQGWSAGGHLTNWLVTHFNFIKAASSGAGMCNWISFYGTTEVKYLREIWFQGTPYEKYNDYLKKSPLLFVKNAKTPTIILCGELDTRVPLSQSQEMYTGLKKAGCKTELIVFPGNGHGLWQLSKQEIKMKDEIEWFRKYLK